MIPPNNRVPALGEESLAALARKHGLPVKTVQGRKIRGDSGDRLIRPSANNGKPIKWGGKTFKEWQSYLKERGVWVSLGAIRGYYYSRKNIYGESPDEILKRFKEMHRI